MLKFLRSRKGFSLVELIVVIVILGILVAIAVPSLIGYIEKSNIASDISAASGLSNAATAYIIEKQKVEDSTIDFGPGNTGVLIVEQVYTPTNWPKAKAMTNNPNMAVTWDPTTKRAIVSAGGLTILPADVAIAEMSGVGGNKYGKAQKLD